MKRLFIIPLFFFFWIAAFYQAAPAYGQWAIDSNNTCVEDDEGEYPDEAACNEALAAQNQPASSGQIQLEGTCYDPENPADTPEAPCPTNNIGTDTESEDVPMVKAKQPIIFSLSGLSGQQEECYYIEFHKFDDLYGSSRIRSQNPINPYLSPDCTDDEERGSIDRTAYTFFLINGTQSDSLTLSEGLPDGLYEIVLYDVTQDKKTDACIGWSNPLNWDECEKKNDGRLSALKFCSGSCSLPPPPFPPCRTAYALNPDPEVDSEEPDEIPVPEDEFLNGQKDRNAWLNQYKVVRCVEVNTAVGPWRTDPEEFVKSVMGLLLSISGAIALGIIIYSGYLLMTSQGDPERIGKAREYLTSAIVGLLFLIFSIVILEIIGVDILRLPGFGR